MLDKVWGEISYPFPNFNGATVEVWEWLSNLYPTLHNGCNDLSMLISKAIHVSERAMRSLFGDKDQVKSHIKAFVFHTLQFISSLICWYLIEFSYVVCVLQHVERFVIRWFRWWYHLRVWNRLFNICLLGKPINANSTHWRLYEDELFEYLQTHFNDVTWTSWLLKSLTHYIDAIMSAMASQITSLTVVYSTVYSDADQRKHQSSASLAFVWGIHRGPVNSPHKGPVTRKMFPFDDVIMTSNSD